MTPTDTGLQLRGVAAAPGIAIGPARRLRSTGPAFQVREVADIGVELLRLNDARRQARLDLEALQHHVAATVSATEAEIFEAHIAFLDDPQLFDEVADHCRAAGSNVEPSLVTVIDGYRELLLLSDDELFRARADDLEDLKQRLLRLLVGEAEPMAPAAGATPCVILADDLLPSAAVQLDRAQVLAFCLAVGGATSHVAILARGLGLPAVVGLEDTLAAIEDGTLLVVDGDAGVVMVNPADKQLAAARQRLEAQFARQAREREGARSPAVTRDGVNIGVVANVSSLAEAVNAHELGAEGVGLLRTELLFIDRREPPHEDEQVAVYRSIADALERRPLIIRTLDIGGDKPVAYLRQIPEQNPALGVRGIRLAHLEPQLMRSQLRAIWRIGPGYPVKVMFPMVAGIDEIHWLRGLVAEVAAEVRASGAPMLDRLEIGVMVEVPSLAVCADQVARHVDFMSIGTNDLTQYTIAVDRTNAAVNGMNDALHPAVLRLIAQVAQAGKAAGTAVSVCGELAGDRLGIPLLAGLGITSLSMAPPQIPAAKAALRRLHLAEAADIARHALDLESITAVRDYLARQWAIL
jgi:phosphoenolpyruvate-protein phosphotransferase